MVKFIKRTLLFILIIVIIASGFVLYQGHKVYKNALDSVSLEDKIQKIKNISILTKDTILEKML